VHTPPALRGPDICLAPQDLPSYAGLSIVRMAAAYMLSLFFALWYGRSAAHNPRVEHVLIPLPDSLQSVAILSFLRVLLLRLSAYLRAAADRGDVHAIVWGVGGLIGVIVALDQLVWRPLLAWSARFKLEMVTSEAAPTSWCYDVWRSSRVMEWLRGGMRLIEARLDRLCMTWLPLADVTSRTHRRPWGTYLGGS